MKIIKTKILKCILIILLMFILLIPLNSCNQEKIESEITIALGYIPNVQFLPFYVAQEKGYFEEEGFKKVNLEYGTSSNVISLLAEGGIDLALTDGDSLIIAREKGFGIQNLFTFYKNNPVCIVSKKEKNITTLQNLVGNTLGTTYLSGSSYTVLKSVIKENNITDEDINLTPIGYTQVQALLEDKVDAAVCFINNEVVTLKNMGIDINIIPIYEMTDLVSACVLINEQDGKENPKKMKALKSILKKSMNYIIENKKEAYSIFTDKIVTDLSEEQKNIQFKVLEETIKLWGDKNSLGEVSRSSWEASINELVNTGIIKNQIKVDSINFKN